MKLQSRIPCSPSGGMTSGSTLHDFEDDPPSDDLETATANRADRTNSMPTDAASLSSAADSDGE